MKRALRHIFTVLLISSCSTSIDLKDYRTDCTQDSDCVPVVIGNVCEKTCACANASLNDASRVKYSSDFATIQKSCTSIGKNICPPCVAPMSVCTNGTCALK